MGEVFLAQDNTLDRLVAIKRLHINKDQTANMSPEFKKEVHGRFIQEARAAARLNHQNIITIYEIVNTPRQPYIVMEYLKGKTLQAWLDQGRDFSVAEVIGIAMQVASGLDYAHRLGVLHRDIKPDNIFLSQDLAHVKINDFGIARVADSDLVQTQVGTFMGTPAYVSPEQSLGVAELDGRCDVYSLGVMMYFLLAQDLPFKADNLSALLTKIQLEVPKSVSTYHSEVSDALNSIIMKTLEKKPENRFQSAQQLLTSLQALQGGEATIPPIQQMASGSAQIQSGFFLSLHDVNFSDPTWVLRLFASCEARLVGMDALDVFLKQLLQPSVFADAFSGAVHIEHYVLLIWKGLLLQAINLQTGEWGEKELSALMKHQRGTKKTAKVFTAKDDLCRNLPLLLNTMLTESTVLHRDLDAAMIDMGGLIRKLIAEEFSGVVRMRQDDGLGVFAFYRGQRVFALQNADIHVFSNHLGASDMTMLVESAHFKADLFTAELRPLQEGLRSFFGHQHHDVSLDEAQDITPHAMLEMKKKVLQSSHAKSLAQHLKFTAREDLPAAISLGKDSVSAEALWSQYQAYTVTQWLLSEGFVSLLQQGQRDTLKYLCTWLPEVTQVHFNHELQGEAEQRHRFDVVCEDEGGKILHILHSGFHCGVDDIESFLQAVISVKIHRLKTGDIGSALYVSQSEVSEEAQTYYRSQINTKKGLLNISYLESLTGFKGFYRMGKNRGFHFCLLHDDGQNIRFVEPDLSD